MKIIATSEQANKKEEDRRIANIGCDICPCCKSKNVEYRFTHYEAKWKFYFFIWDFMMLIDGVVMIVVLYGKANHIINDKMIILSYW